MTTPYQVERRRVAAATEEARKFIKKAQEFLDANVDPLDASPKRASMKRQSMELTKALSQVRKSVWSDD